MHRARLATVDPGAQADRRCVDVGRIRELTRELLVAIGEDPDRDGLRGTPERVARWWSEFVDYDPGNCVTAFEGKTDQMVIVAGIRVWSLCEHHLLPFWCDVSIGYIARTKILGLSKFARIAHGVAHGLQIQERLAHQIADEVQAVTESADVAVAASGEHLCMTMRGIQTPATMKTHVMRGLFFYSEASRAEFFQGIAR